MVDPSTRTASSAGDVLEAALSGEPEREALVAADARLTYRQLDDSANRAAAALADLGVRRGDVVAVSLSNTSDVVVTFHATMRLGALWLGVNRNLAPPEKRYIIEDAGAHLLLADPETVGALAAESEPDRHVRLVTVDPTKPGAWHPLCLEPNPRYSRARSEPTDPAGIAYTSGTTGRPKGVVHSHRNILLPGAVLAAVRRFGPELRKGDSAALTILNMQVTATLLVAQVGGTQVVMDRPDPVSVAGWIERERVTSWFAVPTLLHGLTNTVDIADDALASLDDVWSGGTDVPDPIRVAFEQRFGLRVHATYGLTEAPTVVTIEPRDEPHVPGSSGQALPHLCLEIRDDAGTVLPSGETGEITVRAHDHGKWLDIYKPMLGYHGQPGATAATVREGVLFTGDLGMLSEDGDLHVQARRNALILRGGANIYPAEVERVLLDLPQVVGAAVIGIADERLGQRVAAGVELAPGATIEIEELAKHCRRQLARYKVPDLWHIGTLPRNAMGKVGRAEIEEWFLDVGASAAD
jgi:long-chain acyl-CoA synthetase